MNKLELNRLNKPDFDELYAMIADIKNFLKEDSNWKNTEWMKNLETILNFQDSEGSFKLLSSYKIPSEARIDFCHIPTYICTSILMKTYLTTDSNLAKKVEKPLIQGLEMSCLRNLKGHGYERLKGQIEALNIFMKGGLREFIDLHPNLNPKFREMIINIKDEFKQLELQKKFKGCWGESYKEDILKINKYFNTRCIFVYGTLMKGEANHHFLENSTYLKLATIDGYELYNVGYYPAIIPGENTVIGELYEVPENDMPLIDTLEGEGSLYNRKCINPGNIAYIYEYAQDTNRLKKINSWKDYVWYVSYGSNMLYERFLCYIKGGAFEYGGSYREPCHDTSSPIESKTLEIPYDMYFGNESGSWNGCGVSFLDTTKKGKSLGVAYLITREQFEHVAKEENSGRKPNGYGSWYENIKTLGEMDGFELVTITNDNLRPYNKPCKEYLKTLARGIKENWSEMSDEDIKRYLNSCIRS